MITDFGDGHSHGLRPIGGHGHQHNKADLSCFNVGAQALKTLMAFKATEWKGDPARLQGIHGPYEELTIRKTGTLPADYFAKDDTEPWGLRVEESRSGILWQVLSGVMDRHPEFGAAYMALALDISLSGEDYAKELRGLNKDFGDFLEHAGVRSDHHHSHMGHEYQRVACPACSTLTALAIRDPGMHAVFKELLPLGIADRRTLLSEKGLMPLLDTMIPDIKPATPKLGG